MRDASRISVRLLVVNDKPKDVFLDRARLVLDAESEPLGAEVLVFQWKGACIAHRQSTTAEFGLAAEFDDKIRVLAAVVEAADGESWWSLPDQETEELNFRIAEAQRILREGKQAVDVE